MWRDRRVEMYIVEVTSQERETEAIRHIVGSFLKEELLAWFGFDALAFVIVEAQKPKLTPGMVGDVDILAGNLDAHSKVLMDLQVIDYHVRKVVHVNDHVMNTELLQACERDFQQAAAIDFNKRFGTVVGKGPEARTQADNYLLHYYAWLGDFASMIAGGAAVSAEMVKGYAAAFEASGCDEIIFVPTSSSLDQIALLREAVS